MTPRWALIGAVALMGCQSYEPLELDLTAHSRQWQRARLSQLDAAPERFDPSDGFGLEEAELVALACHPSLRALRLRAEVPRAGAEYADLWPDPSFQLNGLRVVSGAEDPWIAMAGLSLTIPLSDRLAEAKRLAGAQAEVARRGVARQEWAHITALREAWASWAAVVERRGVLEAWLEDLAAVVELARKQRELGRIGAPDLRVLELEALRRASEVELLGLREARQVLELKGLMGLHPSSDVALVPILDGAPLDEDPAARRAALRSRNLSIAEARGRFEAADRAYRLALARQVPDLSIGPQGGVEDGETRLGGAAGLTLPLWNRNRRAIAEARAARAAAHAEALAAVELAVGQQARAEAQLDLAERRRAILERRIAPLVDRQLRDLRRLAKIGDLDVLILLDGLNRSLNTRLELIEARLEIRLAQTALRALLPPAPAQGASDED